MDKRVMIVGLDGAGKSTLADAIEGAPSDHRHREDCFYRERCFETPGRYVENHWMHNALIMLAQNQACGMVLLIDGETGESLFSSGYARAVTVPCLGVLTKCERLDGEAREAGLAKLRDAGCGEAICLSTATGEGMQELLDWADRCLPVRSAA